MTDEGEINIFKALDFIRDAAPTYARAKADRVYLENYRKTKKALLMRKAEQAGHKSASLQEREAYADDEYVLVLRGLQEATEEEERLRWMIVAAEAKIEAWRTIESSKRLERKVIP